MARRRRGLTLVEAVLLVALGLLLFRVAMGMFVAGWGLAQRGAARIDGREAALLTLSILRDELQDAVAYHLSEGGERLEFSTPAGAGEVRLEVGEGRLVLVDPGTGAERRLPAREVRALQFEAGLPGLLRLDLVVAPEVRGQPGPEQVFTEEIGLSAFVQSLGARHWNPAL